MLLREVIAISSKKDAKLKARCKKEHRFYIKAGGACSKDRTSKSEMTLYV
jgi:hypothetical protein